VGQLHVPVGREVSLTITGGDVIHSFWVPKLAGKLDAIPGRENVMWIRVDEPGSYSGQCAEFCGLGHAGMKLTLTALSSDDFQKWENEVTASPGQGTGGG
jgi:cytochrome c oxidase subunit 2